MLYCTCYTADLTVTRTPTGWWNSERDSVAVWARESCSYAARAGGPQYLLLLDIINLKLVVLRLQCFLKRGRVKRQARRDPLKGLAANSEALPGPTPQTPASPASAALPKAREDTQGTSATGRRRAACPPEDKDASPLAPLRRPGRAPHSPVQHPASRVPPSPISSGWVTRQTEPPPTPLLPKPQSHTFTPAGPRRCPSVGSRHRKEGAAEGYGAGVGHGRLSSPPAAAGQAGAGLAPHGGGPRRGRAGRETPAWQREDSEAQPKPRPPVPVPLGATHPPASRWSRVLCCAMARRSDAEPAAPTRALAPEEAPGRRRRAGRRAGPVRREAAPPPFLRGPWGLAWVCGTLVVAQCDRRGFLRCLRFV